VRTLVVYRKTPAEILRSPTPVGTAIAVAPGQAAVGQASEPDDVVVFELDGDGPRMEHERASASG
jgi:TPP-dependent pyruvate/acetoin dehydrogenase alpha subunit